ncbi:uncharacterized protein LOC143922463 [Arctopsyche grandis]|uniref:uncharacterized protein LOC143922463 n=1 Tax=Arctopsyche grandis TaxID=121162 RepID=UPI00406D91DF
MTRMRKPVTSVTSRQRTRHTTMMISKTIAPMSASVLRRLTVVEMQRFADLDEDDDDDDEEEEEDEVPYFDRDKFETYAPRFKGIGGVPISRWIEHMEEFAKFFHWTPLEQLVYGRIYCVGTARMFLNSEGIIISWTILKQKLIEEFQWDDEELVFEEREMLAQAEPIDSDSSGAGETPDDEPRVTGPVRNRENRERERPQCYNCGGRGHLAADCRFKTRGTRCFNCNEFGHISAQCNSTKTKTVLTIQEEIRKEVSIPGAALLGSPITESVLMCIDGSKVKCVKKPCVLMEVNLERSLPRRKKEQDMRDRKEVWQQACKRPLQQRASREMSAQRELIVSNDEEDDANMADGGVNLADVSVNSDGLHRKRPLQQRASREMSAQRELIVSNDEEDDANMADGGVNLADGSMDGDGLQRRRLWDYGDIPFSNTDEPPDDQFGKGSKDYSHLKNSEDENKEKEKHKDKEKDMAKSQEGLRDPVKISTPKDTVFTFKLSRSRIDVNSMEKKIEPWIEKRLTGCISELEPICVDFIYGKLLAEYLWGDGRFLGQSQRIAEGIG